MADPRSFERTRIHRNVVDSTNNLARSLLEQGGVELPLLVRADRQTAGRGRGSHTWWSGPGSLIFSLGLDPAAYRLRDEQMPRVALATAVAIVEALEALGPGPGAVGIRWPNDLEAGGLKLGGILPERIDTALGPRLIIGVGLNVRTDLDAAPAEVRRMATSIHRLDGHEAAEPDGLLAAILARFGPMLEALGRDSPELAGRWADLDTLRGLLVRIDLGGRIVAGRCLGITPTGGLRIDAGEFAGPVVLHGGQVLREVR